MRFNWITRVFRANHKNIRYLEGTDANYNTILYYNTQYILPN